MRTVPELLERCAAVEPWSIGGPVYALFVDNGHHRRFWASLWVATLGFVALLYFAASRPSTQEMKYDQFLAVMLTALGVMLAAVTLFVGLLAVFGYQFIRDEARKRAEAAANETATKVARETAEVMVDQTMRETSERAQATGLSEGQAEGITLGTGQQASENRTGKKRATSDKGLEKD